MSYLTDFEEINGGYVAFRGNPKSGKITGKGKIKTGKLDFDDVYFVKEIKFNLFSVSQMYDKKNNVLFTDTECIVLSPDFKLPDENQVLLRVPRENNMYNDETSPILKTFITGIENQLSLKLKIIRSDNGTEFKNQDLNQFCGMKGIKREFSVARTPQQNGIAERKNRTLIEAGRTMLADSLLPIPFWAEAFNTACYVLNRNTDDDTTFKVKEPEFAVQKHKSDVHVSPSSSAKTKKHDDKTKIEAKGNSHVEFTNTFSFVGPSNTVVSPTLRKSSYVDPSQYLDDPDMPTLKDITYYDDEEDVGAEADFSNLETIPRTMSMTRMVKEQGGLTQINNDDFYTCMFAYFLSQEEPKRVHQALKDPSWIKAIQEELLQFKMQKVWVLVDLPKGHTQEKGIDYEEVFALVARIEAIRLIDGKSAITPIDTEKPVLKDPDGKDVDVHTYRYLKGKPLLGLWYPKDSSFNLVAYSDSDYAGASLDRKSITGGCQFLGCKLISWQCKKQTLVATSSTEAKYAAAASCCAQVLWIQNQLLDYGKKVIITEDIVCQALHLDDAESIDCLPNEGIFVELARMGYEKPYTKLTFYKAFFSAQWKFLIHTILQCMSAKRTAWNKFSSSMASAVICLATGKGFSRMNTPLFEGMLVQQQAANDVDDVVAENVPADVVVDDVIADVVAHVAAEPTPPSPTPTTTPPPP
nr:uncharacterized mitochondrial protein AtMg00810-like [Tanacetum cinerariifolium]